MQKVYTDYLCKKRMDETVICDHSNKSYRVVLSCDTVYYDVEDGSKFKNYGHYPSVRPLKIKAFDLFQMALRAAF